MRHKIVRAVGGCVAAALTQTASPNASAAPENTPPHPQLTAARSSLNRPSVFTLRYVAFIALPKTSDVAARYKGIPPVLAQNLASNSRYAMMGTPEDFTNVLQAEQPDHSFKIGLAGSAVLYDADAARTRITDGPNPSDPYGLTLVDNITISQNSDRTLDFASKGTLTVHRPGSGEWGGTTGWDGENKELAIGQTYLWGVDKKPDGTCITWAFCILPGRLDQIASTWNRRNGARTMALASDKNRKRRLGQ